MNLLPGALRRRRVRPGPFILSDDPADHGLSETEVACIEQAYEIRRREVRAALTQHDPFRLDWELSGFGRPKTLKEWVTSVLVVPLVVVLFAVLRVVTAPFEYVSYRRERARRRAHTSARRVPNMGFIPSPLLVKPHQSFRCDLRLAL